MKTLPEIYQDEIKVVVFDLDREMEASMTASAMEVVATVHRGNDPSPELLLVGLPQIVGRFALQRVRGRVPGCIYKLRGKGSDSDGLVHVIPILLPCRFD